MSVSYCYFIVAAQNHYSIIIAHPGQDVELLCDVTPSGNGSVAWVINHMVPYELPAIRGGTVLGYTSNLGSNNLLITNVMMDDDRNDTASVCDRNIRCISKYSTINRERQCFYPLCCWRVII